MQAQYFLMAVCLILWCVGLGLFFRRLAVFMASELAEGRLAGWRRLEFAGANFYFAVIEFAAKDGSAQELLGSRGYSVPPKEALGAPRKVLYLEGLSGRRMEYEPLRYWGASVATLALALLLSALYFRLYKL
jgi:hypothetical protein